MFTGIVSKVGIVKDISAGKIWNLEVEIRDGVSNFKPGDSVAVNGVCLTVTQVRGNSICFEVISETVKNTNINNLHKKDRVNLEESLKVNDSLSGHLVTGHIDGTGRIVNLQRLSRSQVELKIETNSKIMKFITSKGSICVDGVSLTVTEVKGTTFGVSLAPFTLENTTFGEKDKGEIVNIEVDLIARYIFNFLTEKAEKGVDKDTLKKYGFM